MTKKVMIDFGHGGPDPGAVFNGPAGPIKESEIVTDVGLIVNDILTSQGLKTALTRGDNSIDPSNANRAKWANDFEADIFVALHCNASKSSRAKGFEVIHAPGSTEGIRLAKEIVATFKKKVKSISARKPPTKSDEQLGRGAGFKLTVLRKTKMPAIIIEIGFISNPNDRETMLRPEEQAKIAEAIASGILNFFGLKGQKKTNEKEIKEDRTVTDKEKKEIKKVEDETLSSWEQLKAIFQDGKIIPKEIPILLGLIAGLLRQLAALLTTFKADPKISGIMAVVAEALTNLAKGIEDQLPKIEAAWAKIETILEDDKVQVSEIPPLLEALADLLEAGITIALPFVTPEFTEAAGKLGEKIKKVLGWVTKIPGMKLSGGGSARKNIL